MYSHYEEFIDRAKRQHGKAFSDADLCEKFKPFFRSGQRIKVSYFGDVVTGTVSVTTGQKPVFILMRNSRSIGSSYTLSDRNEILAVQGYGGKYEAVK